MIEATEPRSERADVTTSEAEFTLAVCLVAASLRDAPGRASCVTCLAIDAQVPRALAEEAAFQLVQPGTFRVANNVCARCGASSVVLYFNELAATVEMRRAA